MLLDELLVVHDSGKTTVASPTRRGVVVEADVDTLVSSDFRDFGRSVVGDEDESGLAVGCGYNCIVV